MKTRDFLIKTCQFDISNNAFERNTMFMHIFVETTQISQLEEAKAQNRYQKQMLANVSHEFRTPLNAMNMSLVLLKDSEETSSNKFVKIAHSSWNILSGLVEDILDHAKIEAGMFEIQQTIFKPEELLEEVREIFELQMQKKHIAFNIEWKDDLLHQSIKTDKQRIKQVLLNLLSNALKFTDKGSIKIKLQKFHEKKTILIPSVQNNLFNKERYKSDNLGWIDVRLWEEFKDFGGSK